MSQPKNANPKVTIISRKGANQVINYLLEDRDHKFGRPFAQRRAGNGGRVFIWPHRPQSVRPIPVAGPATEKERGRIRCGSVDDPDPQVGVATRRQLRRSERSYHRGHRVGRWRMEFLESDSVDRLRHGSQIHRTGGAEDVDPRPHPEAPAACRGRASPGKGWLHGTQTHLEFIPERHTDFIFAVFSEEFGLIGNVLLLVLYALLIGRGLMIAANAATVFARLLAASLALMFFTYAFVNMGMVSGILPVVGVPLPFISYGGTALVTLYLAIGILMSVHRHRRLVQS